MKDGQILKFNVHIEPIGIVKEAYFQLIKIPKQKYSKLVKNKKIGDQMWFKELYNRKARPYHFGVERYD